MSGTSEAYSPDGEEGLEILQTARPLRPLGQTVDKLEKLAPKRVQPNHSSILKIPVGAKFLDGSYTCTAGTRTYKLYVPSSLSHHRPGLIVMLHGCTQNAIDFATGTGMNEFAETERMIIVYPNQVKKANSSGCWNWFNPRDQIHSQGEPSIIAGITQELFAAYNVDPNLVFIAGLSAGGAMAVILGHTYPNLYSAIGVHSGLPYQCANDVISAFSAMKGKGHISRLQLKPKIIVFHGDADKTVHPSNGLAIVSSGGDLAVKTVHGVSANGRKYTKSIFSDKNNVPVSEHWTIHGAGHAWSGGNAKGTYTDSKGPNASKEMMRFFLNRRG